MPVERDRHPAGVRRPRRALGAFVGVSCPCDAAGGGDHPRRPRQGLQRFEHRFVAQRRWCEPAAIREPATHRHDCALAIDRERHAARRDLDRIERLLDRHRRTAEPSTPGPAGSRRTRSRPRTRCTGGPGCARSLISGAAQHRYRQRADRAAKVPVLGLTWSRQREASGHATTLQISHVDRREPEHGNADLPRRQRPFAREFSGLTVDHQAEDLAVAAIAHREHPDRDQHRIDRLPADGRGPRQIAEAVPRHEPSELRADLIRRPLAARFATRRRRAGELFRDPTCDQRGREPAHACEVERLDPLELRIGEARRRTDEHVADIADMLSRERPVLRARDAARLGRAFAVGADPLVGLGLRVVLADLRRVVGRRDRAVEIRRDVDPTKAFDLRGPQRGVGEHPPLCRASGRARGAPARHHRRT